MRSSNCSKTTFTRRAQQTCSKWGDKGCNKIYKWI